MHVLKAGIINFPVFKALVQCIENVIDEIRLDINEYKIVGKALDRSNISFIEFFVGSQFFSTYSCCDPQNIWFDTEELVNACKHMDKAKFVSMEVDKFSLTLRSKHPQKRRYRVNAIESNYEPPEPPKLEQTSTSFVNSKKFFEAMKTLKNFHEHLNIVTFRDVLMLDADGATTVFDQNLKVDGEYKSRFTIDKILEMKPMADFGNRLILKIGNDMPLGLICKANRQGANISYLLAPRVGDEVEKEDSPNEVEGENNNPVEGDCRAEV